MLTTLAVIVVFLLVISAGAVVGPRIGVAAPLVLVLTGLGVSLLPWVPEVRINPELILQGLLPPLLYAAAVAIPPISFRREFKTISSLSVVLVIVSALALGLLFAWLVPDLGFVWGVAMGAILSPTDAAASSIARRAGMPKRAVVLLEGESLLNDATALVLLRTAVVAAAGAFSFWDAIGTFAYSVAVAVAIGAAAGWAMLAIRARIGDPKVATVLSFTVPFVASLPAEALQASGLVAAVVAGLVTSFRGPRVLPPQHRLSDRNSWAPVALVLEGLVFAIMGLELTAVVSDVNEGMFGVAAALLVAVVGLAASVVVRACYTMPTLWGLERRLRRREDIQEKLSTIEEHVDAAVEAGQEVSLPADLPIPPTRMAAALPSATKLPLPGRLAKGRSEKRKQGERTLSPEQAAGLRRRIRKSLADIDYLATQPLGRREGIVVVWAGMRGAVTLATAQTLPLDAPHRSFLVLVAFSAATVSLLLQGLTVGPLTKWLYRDAPAEPDPAVTHAQTERVRAVLDRAAEEAGDVGRVELLRTQRRALLDFRSEVAIDPGLLDEFLLRIDAEEMEWEMLGPRIVGHD